MSELLFKDVLLGEQFQDVTGEVFVKNGEKTAWEIAFNTKFKLWSMDDNDPVYEMDPRNYLHVSNRGLNDVEDYVEELMEVASRIKTVDQGSFRIYDLSYPEDYSANFIQDVLIGARSDVIAFNALSLPSPSIAPTKTALFMADLVEIMTLPIYLSKRPSSPELRAGLFLTLQQIPKKVRDRMTAMAFLKSEVGSTVASNLDDDDDDAFSQQIADNTLMSNGLCFGYRKITIRVYSGGGVAWIKNGDQ